MCQASSTLCTGVSIVNKIKVISGDYILLIKNWRGFPRDSVAKNSPVNAGDSGLTPGSERSPEEEMATTHASSLGWRIP